MPQTFPEVRSRYQRRFRVAQVEGRKGRQERDGISDQCRSRWTLPVGHYNPGLETGALLVKRRDPVQGGMLLAWLDGHVLPAFAGRVLAIDTAVAQRCAKLHVPDPRAERDALIAATALVHGMTVVTRNVTHFELIGVAILNPWNQ